MLRFFFNRNTVSIGKIFNVFKILNLIDTTIIQMLYSLSIESIEGFFQILKEEFLWLH